jgi:hypothetical protein
MDLNFLEALEQGRNEADDYEKNIKEVETIFDSVEMSLKQFLADTSIELTETLEQVTENKMRAQEMLIFAGIQPKINYTGYRLVSVTKIIIDDFGDNVTSHLGDHIFKYKLGDKVYPIEVIFQDTKAICADSEGLVQVIKRILADGQTVRLLRRI